MFAVVTGGSGSGKSAYAEQLVGSFAADENIYVATMMCFDEESRARVRRHRKMRESRHFATVERYVNLKELSLGERHGRRAVLLECMSNLAANEMFDPGGSGRNALPEILDGIDVLRSQCDLLVVVTNEIFSDGYTYDPSTVQYQQLLGRINQEMAARADMVTEVVYGIPLCLKGTSHG